MIEAKQNDLLCLAWQAFEGERREVMTHVNMKDRESKRNTSKDAIFLSFHTSLIHKNQIKTVSCFVGRS